MPLYLEILVLDFFLQVWEIVAIVLLNMLSRTKDFTSVPSSPHGFLGLVSQHVLVFNGICLYVCLSSASPPHHEIHSSVCPYLLMMMQKLRKERFHTTKNSCRWLNSEESDTWLQTQQPKWGKRVWVESYALSTISLSLPLPRERKNWDCEQSTELEA